MFVVNLAQVGLLRMGEADDAFLRAFEFDIEFPSVESDLGLVR